MRILYLLGQSIKLAPDQNPKRPWIKNKRDKSIELCELASPGAKQGVQRESKINSLWIDYKVANQSKHTGSIFILVQHL